MHLSIWTSRLGVDPKKADQMVRGVVVSLPHGVGKEVYVCWCCVLQIRNKKLKMQVLTMLDLDDYVKKIEGGWTDIDVIVTMPTVMAQVGKLGRVLGPRGLMPNPKSGTVTMDIGQAVKEVKAGKIDFKVDKFGIIHTSIGKISFDADKIKDNALEMIQTVSKLKPSSAKGTYFKSITISSTMSSAESGLIKSSIASIIRVMTREDKAQLIGDLN